MSEDIHKLAEAYADYECGMSKHTGKKLQQLHEDKIVEFFDVWGFLIETHCIVPKRKVREWEVTVESSLKADRVIAGSAWRFLWESLFGSELEQKGE